LRLLKSSLETRLSAKGLRQRGMWGTPAFLPDTSDAGGWEPSERFSWEARPRGERRRQPAISQLRKPQSASPNDSAHSGRHCPARQRCTSCRASSCISLRVTPLVQPKPSCKGYSPPPACSALGRSTYFSTSLLSRSNS